MNRENDRRKMRSLHDWIDEARHAGRFPNVARAVEPRLQSETDEEVRRSLNFELAGAYNMGPRARYPRISLTLHPGYAC